MRNALALVILLSACSSTTTPAPQLQLTVPFAPQRVLSPDWQNVAYEVDIVGDYQAQGYTLTRVEVLDAAAESTVLKSYEGASLTANLLAPKGTVTIPMMLVWLKVAPSSALPAALTHRFHFVRSSDGVATTLVGGKTSIDLSPVRVIAAPLKGERYLAAETTDGSIHHFRLPVMVGGLSKNPQRFAVDWLQTTADHSTATPDDKQNANYPSWGADLLGVADGTVVDARDGLEDHAGNQANIQVAPADVTGNHVYVDIGKGQYAVYAHCQSGSVVVKKGDAVKTGQVLCKMGNSGMSFGPHLHFQLSNGPDPLVAESVPYVIDKLVVTGRIDDKGVYEAVGPRTVTERLPDYQTIVTLGM